MVNILKGVREWLASLVSVPLTEQEVRDAFPHLETCTCDRYFDHIRLEDVGLHLFDVRFEQVSNLEPVMTTTYEQMGGHWFSLTLPTERHYLKCRHCGARVQYRVSNDTAFDQLAHEDRQSWMHLGQLW